MKNLGFIISLMLGFMFYVLSSKVTAQQCSPSPTSISSCGSNSSSRTFNTSGTWSPTSCSGTTRGEGTWRYTAQYSGMHPIYIASISGSTTSSSTWCVYVKAGTTCSTSGWSFVGSRTSASTFTEAGDVFMEAGQTYLIGVDWRRSTAPTSTATVSIRVGCVPAPPAPCTGVRTMTYCGTTYTQPMNINSAWNGSTSGGCTSLGTTRGENTWRFTPTLSGNYPVYLASISGSTTSSSYYNIYYRSGSCSNTTTGWTCIGDRSSASTFTPAGTVFLEAGTTYHFLVDWRRSTAPTSDATIGLRVGCYTPPNPCSSTPPTLNICTSSTTTTNFTGFSGNTSYQSFCSGYGYGEEYIYRFTTQAAGNYRINVTSISGSGNREVAYKLKQSTICSSSGWSCVGARSTTGTLNLNNLAANTTYLLMLDAESREGNSFSHTFNIECPPCADVQSIACGLSATANLPAGTGAGWDITDCSSQNTPGAEKLFSIFPSTTGTYDFNVTAANGTIRYFVKPMSWGCDAFNWTCIGSASAPGVFTVSLTGGVPYYILADAAGTQGASQTFIVECLDPCQGYSSIQSCGIPVLANFTASTGAGWNNVCGPHSGAGKERVFEYTPVITGPYAIQVTASTGPATYYYRTTGSGCGSTGWTCIDAMPTTGSSQTISLTAGVSYLILADSENPNAASSQTFELTCAPHDPCLIQAPALICGSDISQLFPNGNGAGWNLPACNTAHPGYEYLYNFTPDVSGSYDVIVSQLSVSGVSFYYRTQTQVCDTAGFICIGTATSPGTAGTVSLSAGTTYTIVAVSNATTFGSVDFRMQGNMLQSVTNLQALNPACDEMLLTWNTDTFALDFELDVATDSLFSNLVGQYNAFSMGAVDSFLVGGLQPATTYYFRVRPIYPCGNGSIAVTTNTTAGTPVNLVPLNNGPLCVGTHTTLSLSATSNFPGPYEWTGPTTFASIQNLNLSPVMESYAGVWTVSVFTSNCGWINATTQVVVHPDPSTTQVGSNQPVCSGQTLFLTAQTLPNASYAWTGPGGFTSSLQNPVINSFGTQDTGVYSLTVNISGCNPGVLTTYAGIQSGPVFTLQSNSPVCEGLSQTLLLQVDTVLGATYSWSGPNGFSSLLQNPSLSPVTQAAAGIYTVTVTSGCGVATDTISVSVIPGISNPAASSNAPVCAGSTLQLSASSHSNAQYFWQGPSGFTSGIQNPMIPNAQSANAGEYSLTISISGCGSSTVSTQVAVQTSPAVVATSNSPVCEGTSAILSLGASTISGATYAWTGPNGFSSTAQNPQLNPVTLAQAGTYIVSATGNCGSSTDSVSVQVIQGVTSPSVTSNAPVCTGGALNLSASTHTGASYFWQGPGGYTASGQTVSRNGVTSTDAGMYSLSITVVGCATVTQTTSVQILSTPTASAGSNGPVCAGNVLYLTTQFVAGATYSWTGPNGFSSTQQNPSVSNAQPNASGIYSLTVNTPSCGTDSSVVQVEVGALINGISARANSPICQGNTLVLTGSNVSGVTYFWNGPGGFTSNQQIASIPGVTTNESGVYTLTVNSPGCAPVLRTVSVSVTQPAILTTSSNSPVCQGNPVNLNVNTISGATYAWTGPNGFVSSSQNPTISNSMPVHSGNYTVTVSEPGCSSQSASLFVEVGAALSGVTASANSPLCAGSNLSLSATNSIGVSLTWSGPNGFASTDAFPIISNVSSVNAGVYTLVASSPGCGTVTRTVNVQITSPVSVTAGSNSPVCQGNALFLNAGTVSGATYLWDGPLGYQATVQNPSRSNAQPTMSGIYTLTVTTGSCGSLTTTTTVEIGSTLSGVAVSSNAPLCVGSNLNLSATDRQGFTFSWSGPNGFVSTLANPSVSNVQVSDAGVYSVVFQSPGCGSTSRSQTVSIQNAPALVASNNGPICQGNVAYLNATSVSGATYSWSGPNGFVSSVQNPSMVNVQPLMSGVYSLTVTTQSCGTLTTTTVVSIGATVSTATAVVNTPICSGADLNFTATSNSNYQYAWSGPSGFASTISNPQILAAGVSNSGSYAVVISSPGCGSITRSLNVTVSNAPPLLPGSNSPVCQGNVMYLTTNGIPGATYLWNGPLGFVSTAMNPGVGNMQDNKAGLYTLTVTTPGCGTLSATTMASVTPRLTGVQVLANTPLCVGSNLNLSATIRNNYTYSWTGPNGFTSTLAEPVIPNVTTANQGNYTVVFTAPGCGTSNRSRSVSIVDPSSVQALNSGPVCVGNAVYFTGRGPAGSTFSWAGPNAFVTNRQNPSLSGVQLIHAGVYTLNVNVPGCGIVSTTTTLVVNNCRDREVFEVPADFGEVEAAQDGVSKQNLGSESWDVVSGLTVSPNPSDGSILNLKWNGQVDAIASAKLSIYDISGKEVYHTIIHNLDVNAKEWNYSIKPTEILPKGVYQIRLLCGKQEQNVKWVVQ